MIYILILLLFTGCGQREAMYDLAYEGYHTIKGAEDAMRENTKAIKELTEALKGGVNV